VYSSPKTTSKILGYTKRDGVKKDAMEIWGSVYKSKENSQTFDNQGNEYSRWIYDNVKVWELVDCDVNKEYGCIDGKYMPIKKEDENLSIFGYLTEDKVEASRYSIQLNINSAESLTGGNISDISYKFTDKPEVPLLFDLDNKQLKSTLNPNTDKFYNGTLVYGPTYSEDANYYFKASNGKEYGYWVRTSSQLWVDNLCKGICNTYSMFELENSKEISIDYFVKLSDVIKEDKKEESVLGTADSNLIDIEKIIKEDKSIDWASITSELGNTEKVEKNILKLPQDAKKVAVVNQVMLNILGLDVNKAIGEEFSASIIFDSKLFDKVNYLAESEAQMFKIIGITPDTSAPTVYVPLGDVKVEGLKNVSKVKIIVKDQLQLQEVRAQIESFGFQTASVVDTVDRIGDLFSNIRIGLFILGLIALGVASLGMFNTLTVSLMEKTREVGLLKTMGMKSAEIKILFLAESVSMSVLGGVSGLVFAYLLGKLISLMLSGLAISQGQSALDITYIPTVLVLSIILLSGIVGIFTGWYPSRRATEVSALNALRYE
jgi:ABC-type antimicrobial peptide transport system permease subunit